MPTIVEPPEESERQGPPFLATVSQVVELPEPAIDLWRAGRLGDVLGVPDDRGIRVEIIGGEVVLTWMPSTYVWKP